MQNPFSLNDKAVVLTGATGVLGNSFIDAITEAGGSIGILGRNEKTANERAERVNAAGGNAIALIADVMDESSLVKARETMLEKFGRIDCLVNAAGGNMPGGVVQPGDDIFEMNMQGMKDVMDLNLYGTMLPTQVFGKAIAKSGNGSIVNISSMSSTQAITKVLGYSVAKAAIDCYTRWFAVELANRYGDKIRMNAIAPGFFLTEQNRTLLTNEDGSLTARGQLILQNTPFKRFGEPSELKGALVYLLSDASRFVTGTVIDVDGGFIIFSGV